MIMFENPQLRLGLISCHARKECSGFPRGDPGYESIALPLDFLFQEASYSSISDDKQHHL